jgi:hypothetical protein
MVAMFQFHNERYCGAEGLGLLLPPRFTRPPKPAGLAVIRCAHFPSPGCARLGFEPQRILKTGGGAGTRTQTGIAAFHRFSRPAPCQFGHPSLWLLYPLFPYHIGAKNLWYVHTTSAILKILQNSYYSPPDS